MSSSCIVWFRSDLRVSDNPALTAAARRGGGLLPVFIFSPEADEDWSAGAATRAWLHQSLSALGRDLKKSGATLLLRKGDCFKTISELIRSNGASAVYWNREYTPFTIERDKRIKKALQANNVEVRSFKSQLLFEPDEVENKAGNPFKVFTPFFKHVSTLSPPEQPLPAPAKLTTFEPSPVGMKLDELALMPDHPWGKSMLGYWTPGARGAQRELDTFLQSGAEHYAEARDRPGAGGVSRLSPHLRFGELSPRQLWATLRRVSKSRGSARFKAGIDAYLRQIVWREFAHHLLFHFPDTISEPFNPRFKKFPWKRNRRALRAWRRGQTGYPMVDAGMRELWATGWMHNRTRMLAASFLTKYLLIHWHEGARWFWNTLVDADLANNTLGWQWTAGCGADAAPYFRIFNPLAQGERFDADGRYVRRWVPELAQLSNQWLQRPWQAPESVLSAAGVRLGEHYPEPIVDHATARERALAAYARVRAG